MTALDFYWHAYKYLPYERVLAGRELTSLLSGSPTATPWGFRVGPHSEWQLHAYRTTYFSQAVDGGGSKVVPLQANLELSAVSRRTSSLPQNNGAPTLVRQMTRYSAHGLHEYRGKFNPQIVRAIGNLLGLRPGDWVLDPFCGSGTTLLEAAHNGWNALGCDLNPLAIDISRAKISAMRMTVDDLNDLTRRLIERLDRRFAGVTFNSPFSQRTRRLIAARDWEQHLPGSDYLQEWFRESVLVQLQAITEEINGLELADGQIVFRVVLSDILRSVSLQDPGDLRVRRLTAAPPNAPAVPQFLSAAMAKVDGVVRARTHIEEDGTTQEAMEADARSFAPTIRERLNAFGGQKLAAVITSPPYATALPYIDTQRLSLILLGHLRREEIRDTERVMIGNRELTPRQRDVLHERLVSEEHGLPAECIALCRSLLRALTSDDGFRRQNVPALVYKYLVDMKKMFGQVRTLLEPGTPYALVVGRNTTTLSSTTFSIDTPRLLIALAESEGFELQESIELDTYQRFDVHQANSIRTEVLVILRAGDRAS